MTALLVAAIVVAAAVLGPRLLPDLARAGRAGLILPPALGRPGSVWVFGRVVSRTRDRGPLPLRALRRLLARNWTGAPVTVRFLGRTAEATSGHDGEFEVELAPAEGGRFPAGVHTVRVETPGASAEGSVHVVPDEAPFLVVTDFDDTLAVSHVTSKRRLFAATFFADAETHPPVEGMPAFYGALAGGRTPPPAFAVVTGWPIQFAPRLVRFLSKHGYPAMALYLRNLGRATIHGYKEPVLRRLAARFPHPFVLVGDSGERDPEIYAAFAREHPGRVLRVYVREADVVGPPDRFAGMCLFRDPAEATRDAVERGIARGGGGAGRAVDGSPPV